MTERDLWAEYDALRNVAGLGRADLGELRAAARAERAETRAQPAARALRKVAELAAQHLADTRPRDGRPPILGSLAGGPAVAHFAELILAITGPPTAENLLWPVPGEEELWPLLRAAAGHRRPEVGDLLARHCVTLGVTPPGARPRRALVLTFDTGRAAGRFFELNGHRLLSGLLGALTGTLWDVTFGPGPGTHCAPPPTPEPDPPAAGDAAVEERVRHTIATHLRRREQACTHRVRDSRGRGPCRMCNGANLATRAAEAIALGHWNLPAGHETPGDVPPYGTTEYRWWIAGVRRAHQLATHGLKDPARGFLKAAEMLTRRHPDAAASRLARLVAAAYPPPGGHHARPAAVTSQLLRDARDRLRQTPAGGDLLFSALHPAQAHPQAEGGAAAGDGGPSARFGIDAAASGATVYDGATGRYLPA
ncbi:hypothetical protein GCM10017673_38660 [Streptosporangium violaceochromogenes]|nr:hypothetical protein GCM10017673_38660 [Streptosporangium violaceochromogenes]